MYEKAFLQDVAMQNYSRYNVSFAALERLPIMRGQALAINSTRWLSSTVGNYQAVLLNSSAAHQAATTYSPPYWDPLGKGEFVKFHSMKLSIIIILYLFFILIYTSYFLCVCAGLVISLTQPCFHLDFLVGAVGLDIHLADLVQEFTYFNSPGGRSYVFLIDSIGKRNSILSTLSYSVS